MSTPTAQGTALVTEDAPTFAKFEVIEGSWRERDTTEARPFRGGPKNQTKRVSFADPGMEYTCDWAVKQGQTKAKIGDVVSSTLPTANYLVIACETFDYGEHNIVQSVTLMTKAGLTLTP